MALKLIIKHHKADYYKFYHGSPQAKKHYQSLANNNLGELVFGCYFIVPETHKGVGHFFKWAREPEVKLRHVVYEV